MRAHPILMLLKSPCHSWGATQGGRGRASILLSSDFDFLSNNQGPGLPAHPGAAHGSSALAGPMPPMGNLSLIIQEIWGQRQIIPFLLFSSLCLMFSPDQRPGVPPHPGAAHSGRAVAGPRDVGGAHGRPGHRGPRALCDQAVLPEPQCGGEDTQPRHHSGGAYVWGMFVEF